MKEVVIQFEPGDADGYPATLFERTGLTLTKLAGPGKMPLTAPEIAGYETLLPGNLLPPAQLQTRGVELFEKLRTALGQPLVEVLAGNATRLYFDLLPGGELHRVPWEILAWDEPGVMGATRTWVRQKHQLCRVFRPAWDAAAPGPAGPLRILIVIGSAASGEVNADEEELEIRRRVHPGQRTIDIESLVSPSKTALYTKITKFRPDVLHFIGHGTSKPAQLEFDGWDWTSGDVNGDVGAISLQGWVPRLVFLNACRTSDAAGASSPMVGAFINRGVKAAVAMQGDIKGTAAGVLAGVFYGALASGDSAPEALSKARALVAQAFDERQAALPALTMLSHAASALPAFCCVDDDYRARISTCELLPVLNFFVNQIEPRRDIAAAFWPILQSDPSYGFVLLRGDSQYGKTLLSAWLLDLSLRSGHHVRYVKVEPESGGVDEFKILQAIWGTRPGPSPLTDGLPVTPTDVAKVLPAANDIAIYATFRQALAEAAADRPVTIVLDQFRKSMPDGSFWILWEHLIAPIARRQVANTRLLLSLGEDDYNFYDIDRQLKNRPDLRVPMHTIRLKPLAADEFLKRFDEYLYFRSDQLREHRERVLELARIGVNNDPKPLTVARLEATAKAFADIMNLPLEPIVRA